MSTEQTPLLPSPTREPAVKWTVVAGIASTWIASFVAAADSTLTSTLSSTIANEFQSLAIISWLGSGYLIALTATQPLSGKLSDIFGRKVSFAFAAFVFTIGNLVCGLAGSQTTLILGRVLAGIGGGGCNSISTFISSDHIPPRHRGLWQGFGTVAFATGMGCGAVIGGGLNDTLGWRWAFLMLGPVSILAVIGVSVFLPQTTMRNTTLRQQLGRVDYGGSITLVSSLALLLVYLNHEDSQAVASGLLIKALIPLAGLSFVSFIIIELYWAKEPMIPLTLFCTPTVLATCLCGWFTSMAIYELLFYVPLYLQLRGYSTTQTGIRLLPESVGGGLGSFMVGLVTSLSGQYSALKVIMPTLVVLASAGFAVISIDSPSILPEIYLFLNGFGFGGMLTVLLLAVLSAVPHKEQAVSTSVLLAFRSIGATIGVSAAGVVFRSRLDHAVQNNPAYMNSTVSLPDVHQCRGWDGCGEFQDDYMYALHGTFQLALGFAIGGFICAMFIKNYKLRSSLPDNTVADVDNDAARGP